MILKRSQAALAWLLLMVVYAGALGCFDDPAPNAIMISPILDVTPLGRRADDATLTTAQTTIRKSLNRWKNDQPRLSDCFQSLSVQIEPKVLYGQQQEQGRVKNLYHWSASLRLKHIRTGLNAEVELTVLPDPSVKPRHLDNLGEQQSLRRFIRHMEDALAMLVKDTADVTRRFKEGQTASQKVLLERISLCEENELDLVVDEGLKATTDLDVRFRLVALIGERKRHRAANQLIDLIDLNHIEWTRTVIRTLSTLEHPRIPEVLSILAFHESPSLQKEVQSAIERLETR
ncbi:MAG: hypothetical protein ACPGQS_04405 [Bradymonadia bacterium]